MRNAREGTPGGSTGRRQRGPAPAGPSRPAGNGGASLFTPAYRVRHADAPGSRGTDRPPSRASDASYGAPSYRQADYGSGSSVSGWADDPQGGGYSWQADGWPGYGGDGAPRVANAIRGFPPVPDEPLPIYPPGPFAAWNRGRSDSLEPSSRNTRLTAPQDSARMLATATITPDEFDTNHSLPAIKDPILTQKRTEATPAVAVRSATRAGGSRAAAPPRSRSGSAGRPSKRARKGSKRQPVRLAIGVAAVIIVAVAAILVKTSLGKPGTNSAANNQGGRSQVSTSPTPKNPGGKWEFIGSRQTDPAALQLSELFPYRFVAGGVFYYSTITKLGHDCRAALIGTALQAAVKRSDCSQVLRASYFSRPQNVMATIGVFNLATSADASAAAHKAGPAEFVAVLPGTKGATSRLGQGSGIEEAVVKGHYLVLVWAETVNLTAPQSRKERRRLTGFMATLIHGTINHSLSYRMVDGRPPPPGQSG